MKSEALTECPLPSPSPSEDQDLRKRTGSLDRSRSLRLLNRAAGGARGASAWAGLRRSGGVPRGSVSPGQHPLPETLRARDMGVGSQGDSGNPSPRSADSQYGEIKRCRGFRIHPGRWGGRLEEVEGQGRGPQHQPRCSAEMRGWRGCGPAGNKVRTQKHAVGGFLGFSW